MRIQHIISTMYRSEYNFLSTMNIKRDVLVVNQADTEKEDFFNLDDNSVKVITTTERGLSKSRNMLLNHSAGDILVFGDDDLWYLDGYDKIIEDAYKKYPKADIITFRFTQELGKETRKQFSKPTKINLFKLSKISSVEITVKRESIINNQIKFNNLLGLGAEFVTGEENEFLAKALKAGLKIIYLPYTIVYLKPDPIDRQKWKDGFNEEYFVKKGGAFYAIYRRLFTPFTLAFLLLKKRNAFKNVSICKAFKWMKQGRKLYKQMENN